MHVNSEPEMGSLSLSTGWLGATTAHPSCLIRHRNRKLFIIRIGILAAAGSDKVTTGDGLTRHPVSVRPMGRRNYPRWRRTNVVLRFLLFAIWPSCSLLEGVCLPLDGVRFTYINFPSTFFLLARDGFFLKKSSEHPFLLTKLCYLTDGC
jgi:hypothetical protein